MVLEHVLPMPSFLTFGHAIYSRCKMPSHMIVKGSTKVQIVCYEEMQKRAFDPFDKWAVLICNESR